MGISLKAKQRFRQRLHNIEDADEIIDALNEFVDRFTLIGGNFSSSNWETVHELNLDNLQTIMVTFSVLGRESIPEQAGFKRTANNPLLTSDIKNKWILKLRGHFYNE